MVCDMPNTKLSLPGDWINCSICHERPVIIFTNKENYCKECATTAINFLLSPIDDEKEIKEFWKILGNLDLSDTKKMKPVESKPAGQVKGTTKVEKFEE